MAQRINPDDKLKAIHFPATHLKIGTWEANRLIKTMQQALVPHDKTVVGAKDSRFTKLTSRDQGDLVCCFHFAKRKLFWEVTENGRKSKIEIQWSDIIDMEASFPENLPGTLNIEVSRPPSFFREWTDHQPRKHTLWQATSDFTGDQATICKRFSLQVPEGILNRHYEKLLQRDPRLMALVEWLPLTQ